MYKEVNRTEPSLSIRVPWLGNIKPVTLKPVLQPNKKSSSNHSKLLRLIGEAYLTYYQRLNELSVPLIRCHDIEQNSNQQNDNKQDQIQNNACQ